MISKSSGYLLIGKENCNVSITNDINIPKIANFRLKFERFLISKGNITPRGKSKKILIITVIESKKAKDGGLENQLFVINKEKYILLFVKVTSNKTPTKRAIKYAKR